MRLSQVIFGTYFSYKEFFFYVLEYVFPNKSIICNYWIENQNTELQKVLPFINKIEKWQNILWKYCSVNKELKSISRSFFWRFSDSFPLCTDFIPMILDIVQNLYMYTERLILLVNYFCTKIPFDIYVWMFLWAQKWCSTLLGFITMCISNKSFIFKSVM